MEQVVLAHSIIIARLDQAGALITQFHLRTQDIKLGHGAGLETPLRILQFAGQRFHRSLVHLDLLGRQQNVVVSQAHGQQSVRQDGLIIKQRLLAGQFGGTKSGSEASPLINGLLDLDIGGPILIGKLDVAAQGRRQGKTLNGRGLLGVKAAADGELRPGDGAQLNLDTVGRAQISLAF